MVTLDDLFPFDTELGYLGILIISFVASLIPFIPIPYFPLLITASFNSNFNPHLIALVSASGIVAAKTIIFFASYYGRKILSDQTKHRMRPLQKLVSRYGWFGAFIAALTPIPDDIVYIPLGLAKYNPWKFATATFAGKILMNEAIVWSSIFLGRPFVERILGETTDPTWLIVGAIASIAVVGVIIYYSLKIDWARIIGRWFPWALENGDNNNNDDDNDNNSKDDDEKKEES
ncbi:DedA family protein [Candidatus Nitrososphaera gargensis Ga9.2]|uniref:DedA family protein n=1 Tax=Nitrososphaera gargensis (strain Ga9.2) TaxID=1237085 RepID=K0III1_NITGG|nr:VTT domain-containing protein [Candidatus Nitrososphaera gargensis]AFU58853.1 DedA family protein [Candidatus Nitrososphaera gargensis Ga9.2]